jgi:Dullard-like phosphatase family protein
MLYFLELSSMLIA